MTKAIDILSALGLPPPPSSSPEAIATLLWAREVLQKHITTTYAVKDPKGIEELKPIRIGGIDQWLHIRGRSKENPVLLYLHGGPGSPFIGFMDAIQRPWEDYFTVVHWDQRQTGKSYYPADDENEPLCKQQFIEDTAEVIQYLRYELNQDKVFLLGHSWGSVLGMHMVKLYPEWLYAYIGVGQVVNTIEAERVLYARLLSHARNQHKERLIAELEAIAPYPDPDSPEKSFVNNTIFVRRELSQLAGETMMHHMSFDDVTKIMAFERLISPHLTLTDITNAVLGDEIALLRSPNTLTEDFMQTDLPKEVGSTFKVPIFFFSGHHDWHTPITLSDKWFDQINAPYKKLLHFEESCHGVVNEEPGKVLCSLVNDVLPFAESR